METQVGLGVRVLRTDVAVCGRELRGVCIASRR